ncbi:FixH family protein [Sphingomonas sp. NSE70-1]|uniref:FixH family protein n=1 Tax=Sphingomonas caseinilyticus TaxID=2908205 RepID=A0ABT0RVS0_9SPHN|nr:FixH family protein [Sphingomonas caseinilyticus]MCL6699006.1 FixH family protein [Sphingomonas caseinilyticus]
MKATRPITGWHATAALVAFFGVVVAVNLTMAAFATRTFGGVVVENSYVASQKYNDWLAAAERQNQLNWKIVPGVDTDRRVTVSLALAGAEVRGFARHPLGREADVPLTFIAQEGGFRSANPLPAGRWNVHLLVKRGSDEARLIESLQ